MRGESAPPPPPVLSASAVREDGTSAAIVVDLGLDYTKVYDFSAATGQLTEVDGGGVPLEEAGTGPRHVVLGPNRDIAYVLNEYTNTITAANYDAAAGSFSAFQTISSLRESDMVDRPSMPPYLLSFGAVTTSPGRHGVKILKEANRFFFLSNRLVGSELVIREF